MRSFMFVSLATMLSIALVGRFGGDYLHWVG